MTEESMTLAVFDAHATMVADLVKKNEVQKFDHTTEAGEKDLRSWVFRLRGGKGDIEKARKIIKAEALAFGKKVDAKAKELTIPLEKMIAENMKPLDEIEAKKRAEAEAIVQAEIDAKEKAERDRLADLEKREAEIAAKEAVQKAIQEKADLTELNRLADIQHEADKLAAIEKVEKKAEQDAKDVAEKAEREKQESIEAEKEKARQVERVRIFKEQAKEKERKHAEEAERKRATDENHRADVHILICNSIIEHADCDKQTAENIIAAIVRGEIPNMLITY